MYGGTYNTNKSKYTYCYYLGYLNCCNSLQYCIYYTGHYYYGHSSRRPVNTDIRAISVLRVVRPKAGDSSVS